MIIGTISIEHVITCKCGYEARGDSRLGADIWLAMHVKLRHKEHSMPGWPRMLLDFWRAWRAERRRASRETEGGGNG